MKKYQPSNGTEGDYFMDDHCMKCINCDPDPNGEKQCEILMRTMMYGIADPEYPTEWIYDENNKPTCTAWVKWDWGKDGDPDDDNNPNKPSPPPDPSQRDLFPLYPSENQHIQIASDPGDEQPNTHIVKYNNA